MLKYQDWYFFQMIQKLECLERAEKYSKREISKNKKNTMSYKSPMTTLIELEKRTYDVEGRMVVCDVVRRKEVQLGRYPIGIGAKNTWALT